MVHFYTSFNKSASSPYSCHHLVAALRARTGMRILSGQVGGTSSALMPASIQKKVRSPSMYSHQWFGAIFLSLHYSRPLLRDSKCRSRPRQWQTVHGPQGVAGSAGAAVYRLPTFFLSSCFCLSSGFNLRAPLCRLSFFVLLLWQFLLTHFLSAATQEVAEFHEAALEDAANLQLFLVLSNHCWRHAAV